MSIPSQPSNRREHGAPADTGSQRFREQIQTAQRDGDQCASTADSECRPASRGHGEFTSDDGKKVTGQRSPERPRQRLRIDWYLLGSTGSRKKTRGPPAPGAPERAESNQNQQAAKDRLAQGNSAVLRGIFQFTFVKGVTGRLQLLGPFQHRFPGEVGGGGEVQLVVSGIAFFAQAVVLVRLRRRADLA